MPEAPANMTYERAWAELQQIVRDLQEEAVGIDELATQLERATELIRLCREKLRQAGQAVDQLGEDL